MATEPKLESVDFHSSIAHGIRSYLRLSAALCGSRQLSVALSSLYSLFVADFKSSHSNLALKRDDFQILKATVLEFLSYEDLLMWYKERFNIEFLFMNDFLDMINFLLHS